MVLNPQRAVRAIVGAERAIRFTLASVFVLDVLTTVVVAAYGNSYLVKTLQGGSDGEAGVVRAKNRKQPMWNF